MKTWNKSAKNFFNENGYVIIEDVLSANECDHIRTIVLKLAKWEKENNTAHVYDKDPSYLSSIGELKEDTNSSYLQRVWNLLSKHEVFPKIIQLPIILEIMNSVFDRDTKHQKYLLSSFQANLIGAGGPEQKLHVDIPVPEPLPEWILKANTIWPIDDFTEFNGATLCLPGSHKSKFKPTDLDQDRPDLVKLTAKKGSVIITHGALWHKSGNNQTKNDRVALLGSFAASFAKDISTEEDYMQVLNSNISSNFSMDLQKILGVGRGIQPGSLQKPPRWKIH